MPAELPRSVYPNGTYAVVGGSDLETRTAQGWRLVQVLATSSSVAFVILQEKDETHAELRRKLETEEKRRREEQSKMWSASRHIEKLERDLEAMAKRIGDLERLDQEHQAQQASDDALHRQMCDTVTRYELDLARVRKFVGEKTWSEAFATKEDT